MTMGLDAWGWEKKSQSLAQSPTSNADSRPRPRLQSLDP